MKAERSHHGNILPFNFRGMGVGELWWEKQEQAESKIVHYEVLTVDLLQGNVGLSLQPPLRHSGFSFCPARFPPRQKEHFWRTVKALRPPLLTYFLMLSTKQDLIGSVGQRSFYTEPCFGWLGSMGSAPVRTSPGPW